MAVCWAYITPELMTWARRKSGLSYAAIAERMKVNVERLKLCERGTRRLTFRQAQKYARVTDVPFGYLFLSAHNVASLPKNRTEWKAALTPEASQ